MASPCSQLGKTRIVDEPDSSKRLIFKNAFKTDSEILCIRFDSDDTHVATANLNGTVQIFNVQMSTAKVGINLSTPENPTSCSCLRWRPPHSNSKSVLTTGDGAGNIIRWHSTTGKELDRQSEKDNEIICMDYDFHGQFLATGGKDCVIRVYDELTKVLEYKLVGSGYSAETSHQNRIYSLKFLPESSTTLISGSWDQNINIWDLRAAKCVGSFIGGKLSGDSIDYKHGKILVGTNTARDQIKIFDFAERKLLQEVDYDKEKRDNGAFIYGAQFSKNNDDSFAVCSGGRNELKIFGKNFQPIGAVTKFSKGLYSLDYGNMSGKIAMGGADGIAVVISQASK